MGIINLLDKVTVDKIAAGEAVERPFNAVKELVENSIDAGADAISVEIKNGGISYIRVTDNGCGIMRDDVRKAFMRHATSKIRNAEDLENTFSLGFRGEALASISAVARVELITKTASEISGTRCVVEGGDEISFDEIGAPDGTTIIIRDLFYNIPARAKFLKTPMTEGAKTGSMMEDLALSHPDIAFQFITNGTVRLSTSGNGKLKDVIYEIYGRNTASRLVYIEASDEDISLKGYIAEPSVYRKNRNMEIYFVNGRYVKSRIISSAIEEGFRLRMMQHNYPFTCFMIEVPPESIDINVHPAKMEIRFYDEKRIYDLISKTIRNTLSGKELINDAGMEKEEKKPAVKDRAEPFERLYRSKIAVKPVESGKAPEAEHSGVSSNGDVRHEHIIKESAAPYVTAAADTAAVPDKPDAGDTAKPYAADEPAPGENYSFLSREAAPKRKILGQVFGTYWLVEYGDRLMMIDQHAAHEKVLFERFMREYSESAIISQRVEPARVFTLNSAEMELAARYSEAFRNLGFELEEFGDREYKLSAVPYNLTIADPGDLFMDILDSIENDRDVRELDTYVHRVATEACKAAVKGGDRMSIAAAERLIEELMGLEDPYHCPHGRPTIISFSRDELDKKFRRII